MLLRCQGPFPCGYVCANCILVICDADDLRPELSIYGCDYMKTPHFDALASESMVFEHMCVAHTKAELLWFLVANVFIQSFVFLVLDINRGLYFRYVAVALCAPSRTAFLTTRRADTSRVWTISPKQYWRISGAFVFSKHMSA